MSIDSTLLPPPLRNIPARAHRRCVVCTTWESSTDFTPTLERGERRRNPSPAWRKDASLGRYEGCGCPASYPEGPAIRGKAALGPEGAGSPRPALSRAWGGPERSGCPQPHSAAPLLRPIRQPAPQPFSSASLLSPAPAEGVAPGKAQTQPAAGTGEERSFLSACLS